MQLLVEVGRAYLVHGYGRGKGCQRQQRVEQYAHHIAHSGQGREGLLEHIGQRDEDKRRPTVWIDTHGEGRGKYHQSGQDRYQCVDARYLKGSSSQVGLTAEVRRIGTQASCAERQGEEGLAQCVEHDASGEFAEVWTEQEVYSPHRPGQAA